MINSVVIFLMLLSPVVLAQDEAYKTQIVLPEIRVYDTQGRELRLHEVVKNKVVIVNFVFTSCATICPMLSGIMQTLENHFQSRLGHDIELISLTVDPQRDTSDKLREYAEKLGAGPHWHWLTGNVADMVRLLKALGVSTGRPEDHPPMMLVGKADSNQWYRWVGIPKPETMIRTVDRLVVNYQ